MRRPQLFLLLAILLTAVLVSETLRSVPSSHKQLPATGENAYFGGGAQQITTRDDPAPEAPGKQEIPGALYGNVVDEDSQPVYAIRLELIPSDKMNVEKETRRQATQRNWTGRNGEFEFSNLAPGEYFLSVNAYGAPTGKHPFAPNYYPGTEQQASAEPIRVQSSMRIELRTLRLRRLPTARIRVRVTWQDGASVPWSNLLFHNPSFPDQGVIGDESLGIRDGQGEVILPMGFDYYARAAVQCDAGNRIRTEESRPVQKIRVDAGHAPTELTFVIPTEQCKLWNP